MVPNFHRPFKLACDTGDFAVGSALLQEEEDDADQNRYAIAEKELFTVHHLIPATFQLLPSTKLTK